MAEETLEPEEIEETRPEAAEDQGEPLGSEAPAGEAEEAEPAAEPQAPAEGAEAEGEGEPEVDFGVQVEDVGTLKKKVTITVPAERIDAKREEMFGELSTTAQVPGFRIGRAPRRLVVKRFGKEVDRDVRNAMIGESLGKALEKSQLKVIGEPDIDLEAIELPASGDMSYELEVEVAPEFDLPELEGIEVIRPTVEVTDERIDEAIDRMRLREVKYEVADEPAAEQDIVTGRAKVSVEGAEESETEVTLRVAPGQIEGLPLVDLGKELTGKEAGQAVPMTVKVPEVHPNEAWQGKEARIELTVGEVRKRRLPEVNDAYAERMGYESVGELREALAKGMKAQVDREAARALREQINEYTRSSSCRRPPPAATSTACSSGSTSTCSSRACPASRWKSG
jgi:trigger factor